MASIKKREDGRYRARYRDASGKEHARHFERKVDAQSWLDTVTASQVRGDYIDPKAGRTTFEAYAADWLTTKADVARSTRMNIEGRLNKWAIPYFGKMPVRSVRPTDARAFVADLVTRGLAPSTVKAIALTTGQVFAQAVDDGMIARSPFANVDMPSDRRTDEMHFLTAEQVNDLAAAITARYQCAIYLGGYGGMRAGELWALRRDRVDVDACTVEVVESMSEAGGLHVGPTKTGKRRTITVPRFLADALREHMRRYPSPDGLVFTAAEGGPVHHRNFKRRHYLPACVKAGLGAYVKDEGQRRARYEGIRFHDLRHTCAALLIAAGRHIEEVKEYLGHSSIRVTSDRYGHVFPKARAELADALDATFRSSLGDLADFSRTDTDSEDAADANQPPREAAELRKLLERTTGLEPATPTLAKRHAQRRDQQQRDEDAD